MQDITLQDLSTKVALHCQSAIRGIHARNNAQMKRWERANIAAYKIQVRKYIHNIDGINLLAV
jgi:hypothetical protein